MPDTTIMRDFIATAADCIERQRAKANDESTRSADAERIHTYLGGAEFMLNLARQFLDDACAAGEKNNG